MIPTIGASFEWTHCALKKARAYPTPHAASGETKLSLMTTEEKILQDVENIANFCYRCFHWKKHTSTRLLLRNFGTYHLDYIQEGRNLNILFLVYVNDFQYLRLHSIEWYD
jgi:hypothetical protein